jgi:hypothetical protein
VGEKKESIEIYGYASRHRNLRLAHPVKFQIVFFEHGSELGAGHAAHGLQVQRRVRDQPEPDGHALRRADVDGEEAGRPGTDEGRLVPVLFGRWASGWGVNVMIFKYFVTKMGFLTKRIIYAQS